MVKGGFVYFRLLVCLLTQPRCAMAFGCVRLFYSAAEINFSPAAIQMFTCMTHSFSLRSALQ